MTKQKTFTIRVDQNLASIIDNLSQSSKESQSETLRNLLTLGIEKRDATSPKILRDINLKLLDLDRKLSQALIATEDNFDLVKRFIETLAAYQIDRSAM